MTFDRQVDVLVGVLLGLLVFVACILTSEIPVWADCLFSIVVFLATLIFGRQIADVILDIFGAA